MPRRDRDDDYHKHDRSDDPPFPGVVRAAAVLWIILGGFFLLASFLTYWVLPLAMGVGNGGARQPSPTDGCSFWLGVALGVGFLLVGLRTLKGSAKDTMAGGMLSLLVALVYISLGAIVALMSVNAMPAMVYVGLTAVLFGCLPVLPGVLALAGRSRYLKWRQAEDRRWRRYERDEEDEDDRPRPSRRRRKEEGPTVKVDCPSCFQTLRVPTKYTGGTYTCPHCQNPLDVPTDTD